MEQSFVTSSTGKLEKVLLCPPVHIALEPIDYISRRWVAAGVQANRDACLKEHAELVQAYRENGVDVIMAEPAAGLTNQVYARDFGACIKEGYILGNFRETAGRTNPTGTNRKWRSCEFHVSPAVQKAILKEVIFGFWMSIPW